MKVPLRATQVLPDALLHAKEELLEEASPVAPESNFVNFEKHILANHLGSLGDCMIYNQETHHCHHHHHHDEEEEVQDNTQATPPSASKDKVRKEDLLKSQSGSFDLMECIYSDH